MPIPAAQPTGPALRSRTDCDGASVASLTARGVATCRLSEFQDVWAELAPADRAWFAEWLRDLLVDAVMEGVPA